MNDDLFLAHTSGPSEARTTGNVLSILSWADFLFGGTTWGIKNPIKDGHIPNHGFVLGFASGHIHIL